MVVRTEVFQIFPQFIKHEGRIDACNGPSILHLDQFAQVVYPVVPSDPIGHHEQCRVRPLLCLQSDLYRQ